MDGSNANTVYLNGKICALPTTPRRLLDWLRHDLGLTGVKESCGVGQCGSCGVLVDDDIVPSCCMLTIAVAGRKVTTIEGLATADPLVDAFQRHGASQCGYCTPGMIAAARAFLNRAHDRFSVAHPMDAEAIRAALAGNICRCTGYVQIVEAVFDVGRKEGIPGAETILPTWYLVSNESLEIQDKVGGSYRHLANKKG